MRGLDFRAKRTGIYLIIDEPLSNERQAQQALARVGRMGEECERVKTSGTDMVNSGAE